MTVKVSKPAINVREELADLRKPTGIAGEAMLRAETPQEQFNLIGAGRRNLVINGDQRIWQRGVGPISANAGNTFCADRWQMGRYGSATGVFTGEQSTDAPDGFHNSVKLTVTTSDTPSGDEAYLITQPFEGLTIDPLAYETSSAKTITVSFWVKSSVVGTYAVSMQDGSAQRACTNSYTINSANTWEYKSVTIVGDTGSGNYEQGLTTKGGMIVFGLGGAGNRLASAMGTWYTSSGFTMSMPQSGGTNWIKTSGATFQITGVQLEVGKVATPFEHRSYGEELAACQRYFERMTFTSFQYTPIVCYNESTSNARGSLQYQVTKRAAPTFSATSNAFVATSTGATGTPVSLTSDSQTVTNARVLITNSNSTLVDGGASHIQMYISSGQISLDAEL